jgi:hypothetical protein
MPRIETFQENQTANSSRGVPLRSASGTGLMPLRSTPDPGVDWLVWVMVNRYLSGRSGGVPGADPHRKSISIRQCPPAAP